MIGHVNLLGKIFRKAGQTAQAIYGWQVGRPSKFFHSKLHAQCNLRQAEGGHKSNRLRFEAQKFAVKFAGNKV